MIHPETLAKIEAVIAQLRDPGVCAASHGESQPCGPNQTARWAARELRRILAADAQTPTSPDRSRGE